MRIKFFSYGIMNGRRQVNRYTRLNRLTRFTGQIGVAVGKLFPKVSQCLPILFRKKADYLINKLGLCNSEVARLVYAAARNTFYTFKHIQRCSGRLFETNLSELTGDLHRGGLNQSLLRCVGSYNLRIEKRHASA